MKRISMVLAVMLIGAGITVYATCSYSSHNTGTGESVKHGSCTSRKGSDGTVVGYQQQRYFENTEANCPSGGSLKSHCVTKNTVIQVGLWYFPKPKDSEPYCTSGGSPHNTTAQNFQILEPSVACTYKEPKPEA